MKYAIVDIETTGGQATSSGITEIAIILHDGNEVMSEYHSVINPLRYIPAYITSLTGITNEMVLDAPAFEEVAAEVYEILKEAVFVAHNVHFDYSFINYNLQQAGYDLKVDKLCTVRLSRKIFPGLASYSLGNLCRSLDIDIMQRHRARGDARATCVLFEKMLQCDRENHIQQQLKKQPSRKSVAQKNK